VEPGEPGSLKPGVGAAAKRLRIDYATAEVLRAFKAAGVRSIVLKGAGLQRWLYAPADRRAYLDCDVLVPLAEFDAAGEVLAGLGFEPELEEADMPDWWREHGLAWHRAKDNVAVDVHRAVSGVHVAGDRLWSALSRHTERVEIGGYPAATLDAPARALHLALHAAQHAGSRRHVKDLERAIELADEETWLEAAALAVELDASAALAAGLSFAEGGTGLAKRLGLAMQRPVDVTLRAEGSVQALTVERFSRARGRERLAMLWHKLVPPSTFMRKWSPLARRGRLGLALAYVWRPLWILGSAPGALRAWLAARRR
jgi:hypothetical protein